MKHLSNFGIGLLALSPFAIFGGAFIYCVRQIMLYQNPTPGYIFAGVLIALMAYGIGWTINQENDGS